MKDLIIDIGNSFCKYAVVSNSGIDSYLDVIELKTTIDPKIDIVEQLIEQHGRFNRCALVSVRHDDTIFNDFLKKNTGWFLHITSSTPMPIENCYETPHTLGIDRLMSAVGAINRYPNKDILLFDMGSAITIDFVSSDKKFIGGNISPGLNIRFRALNTFTKKLPIVNPNENIGFIGKTTHDAILNGVVKGIIYEIEGYINDFEQKNDNFVIIFTGGDAKYFENKVKNTIFVNSNLLIEGLQKVLEFNYAYKK